MRILSIGGRAEDDLRFGSAEQPSGHGSLHYQASASADVRGSAAALTVPVAGSITMPAESFSDHGPRMVTLWPRCSSSVFTVSGIRPSNARSPGYIVWGNGDAGKLRVDQRAAS